jgi:hypothetical protein
MGKTALIKAWAGVTWSHRKRPDTAIRETRIDG